MKSQRKGRIGGTTKPVVVKPPAPSLDYSCLFREIMGNLWLDDENLAETRRGSMSFAGLGLTRRPRHYLVPLKGDSETMPTQQPES